MTRYAWPVKDITTFHSRRPNIKGKGHTKYLCFLNDVATLEKLDPCFLITARPDKDY